jgi:hypothetical protein
VIEYSDDISTPSEQDLESCYGSKYLSAADLGDQKIKARIARIRKEELRQDNGAVRGKFVLFFDVIDKGLVLNQTNKTVLVDALGKNPASWIGATVGLLAESVQFGGKTVRGLRVRVLHKPAAASAHPPAPKPTPVGGGETWPVEDGDPGPDFANAADF